MKYDRRLLERPPPALPLILSLHWRCEECDEHGGIRSYPNATESELQALAWYAHRKYSPKCKAKKLQTKRSQINPNLTGGIPKKSLFEEITRIALDREQVKS